MSGAELRLSYGVSGAELRPSSGVSGAELRLRSQGRDTSTAQSGKSGNPASHSAFVPTPRTARSSEITEDMGIILPLLFSIFPCGSIAFL
ncbi:hypothetical protein B0O99DRAFT_354147 [Bisporella sp. PMI_857]|nr:hypothetical protein B0O99DRAFT_354147 [Bisporella sp. PMI_857]